MATYYIRKTGSDAAAGTSAGAAWLTLGKALGAAGISSGDTVYVGAGVYRELVTIAMTSAAAETKVVGDFDGAQTGDAGEVIWSAYTAGDTSASSATSLLTMAGRKFLTFENLTFVRGNAITVLATTTSSTSITFRNCTWLNGHLGANSHISCTIAHNVVAHWLIENCRVLCGSSATGAFVFTLTTGATADWDADIIVRNCLFLGGSGTTAVSAGSSGTSANEGGGVIVRNCKCIGSMNGLGTVGTRVGGATFTYPCKIENCVLITGSTAAIVAGESGAVTEDYNVISATTARTNVTAGTHSVSDGSYAFLFDIGQALALGFGPRPFGMPTRESPLLGYGNAASAPTTDMLGFPKPAGAILKGDTGTATAGAAKTLTNSGKTWIVNGWACYTVKIISGTGSGQTKNIASNTATVLTVDGNWKTNPDSTSVYMIYLGAQSSSGTATSGTTTTLTDSNAAWAVNMWAGFTLKIDGGTGSGQSLIALSNTSTAITFAAATAPDNTSTYKLFRGTDENTINPSIGCYERSDTPVRETTTIRTGANALRIQGAGTFDISIPVAATSTVVSVYTQFDSAYAGTKPQLSVLNGTECGVANASATAVGSANAWELLTLTIVPTSIGVVTLRLTSNCTAPTGTAFFDDFSAV